jgi:hypothetical protein
MDNREVDKEYEIGEGEVLDHSPIFEQWMKTNWIVSSLTANKSQGPPSPFVPAPTLSSFRIGAQSKKKPRRPKSSFYSDTRWEIDGTWKGGVDSTQIHNSQRPHDENLFPSNVYDDEYDVDYYCYSHVCMADHRSPQELPFYKDHWLIDLDASNHITPYLGDFSSLLQGEHLASTANGSIIQMHGPGSAGFGLAANYSTPLVSVHSDHSRQLGVLLAGR